VSRSYDSGGLATDGYLTFSGDEDNPAFIGDGPFHQAIGGTFDLNSSQTRFPCSLTVSFWRTVAPIDATTNLGLTGNTVTFTCVTGQFQISPEGVVLNPGESYTFSPAVPQVALLSGDPHSAAGTFGGFALCDNTQVAVQARLDWSSPERMHVLYGIVRECYEEENPCVEECSGSGVPDVLYITISNYTGPTPDGTTLNGTYVVDRMPGNCYWWHGVSNDDCLQTPSTLKWNYLYPNEFALRFGRLFSGVCHGVGFTIFTQVSWDLCLRGVIATGTNGTTKIAAFSGGYSVPMTGSPFTNSFDWKIEA
jgi:hypothetical protein